MDRLFDRPHVEVTARLRAGAVAYLLVDPVEYHGPHLPLHTDRLLSLGLARDLAARLGGDALLAEDLEVGVEPAPGPGTRPSTYAEVRRAAIAACRSLLELGATRIVVVTFHGAPLHNLALARAVAWARHHGARAVAPFQEVLRAQLEIDTGAFAPAVAHLPPPVAEEVLRELRWDFHAGFFETSLVLHWAPDAVSPVHRRLPPCPPIRREPALAFASRLAGRAGLTGLASELELAAVGAAWTRLRPFPGYTGHPAHATPEAGALFAREIVGRLAPGVEDALAGRTEPRPPPLAWVGPLTLWGWLGPGHPALGDIAPPPG